MSRWLHIAPANLAISTPKYRPIEVGGVLPFHPPHRPPPRRRRPPPPRTSASDGIVRVQVELYLGTRRSRGFKLVNASVACVAGMACVAGVEVVA